jgi:hypothetical protein
LERLPTVERYRRHLEATARWLLRSVRHGRGGSCAYYMPLLGWSRPSPETSGYLIPTLLKLDDWMPAHGFRTAAVGLGQWLLGIQLEEGAWQGGLWPNRHPKPSPFNTGQILVGMTALYRATRDPRWLTAASRGASWLAGNVSDNGPSTGSDDRACPMPSHYTHVAWPMLEVWRLNDEPAVREAAERILQEVVMRRDANGSFAGWGLDGDGPASTHTIARTLRGLLESARLLDAWSEYGEPAVEALERLARQTEFSGGALPGAFDTDWQGAKHYCCLAGNAEIALCLLIWEQRERDLRIVNPAAKLIDYVCARQQIHNPWPGIRGGVAGSAPLWQGYMRLRYPNWAAKYHCDALMRMIERIESEMEGRLCGSYSRPDSTVLQMS